MTRGAQMVFVTCRINVSPIIRICSIPMHFHYLFPLHVGLFGHLSPRFHVTVNPLACLLDCEASEGIVGLNMTTQGNAVGP